MVEQILAQSSRKSYPTGLVKAKTNSVPEQAYDKFLTS